MVHEKQKETEMKKLITIITMLAVLAMASAGMAGNYDSIVRVEAPRTDTTDLVWIGVGFFVTKNHIVTCAHIVNAAFRDYTKDVQVLFHDKRYNGKLLSMDTKKDIALLYIKDPIGSPFAICDNSIPGQRVVMNHFDEDLNIVGKTGRIKKLLMGREDLGDIQVGIKAKHGYSGSPVIRNSCVVGMIQSVKGFSLGARNLTLFLAMHGITAK
jgi:S1-C subfamily serine protease